MPRYTANGLTGTLYVVATPIGNLEDITLRALRVLRDEVAVIACEDTRQTQKLLTHYDIHKPLISYHEHNETSRTQELVAMLLKGDSIALVSDAGTPLLSDPGYRVVVGAIADGIPVVPIPGASAALAGLAASGLPTDSFLFLGFLPPKAGARRTRLETVAAEAGTLVLYESPHRVIDTLATIEETLGNRRLVLAREVTKLHEEFLRGTVSEVRAQLASRASVKGEITILIGRGEAVATDSDPASAVAQLEAEEGLARMDAIKTVARRLGVAKREVYRAVEERDSNHADRNRDGARIDR